MKNIEKYKETRDALEAFRAWYKDHKHSVLTMSGWLEKEYEAPPPPTLLEAASDAVDTLAGDVVKGWYKANDTFVEKMRVLRSAIASEKLRPVRNCDKFATQEEAVAEFMKICDRECEPYKDVVTWLYEKADKEKAK